MPVFDDYPEGKAEKGRWEGRRNIKLYQDIRLFPMVARFDVHLLFPSCLLVSTTPWYDDGSNHSFAGFTLPSFQLSYTPIFHNCL